MASRVYIKKAEKTDEEADLNNAGYTEKVTEMLADIKKRGKEAILEYSKKLDKYEGAVVVTRDEMKAAGENVPLEQRKMIDYAHARIKMFAEAQRRSVSDFSIPMGEGGVAGQRVIPMQCAGCYCPGGRYTHVASALMSCTTARAAGVSHVVLASPPKPGVGVPPGILYAAHLAGADFVLALGGVQAIAALKHGFFTGTGADILVGPGSGFVAEAKLQLSGPDCAIDLFAGPTETCCIATDSTDAEVVAVDIISQAEHGPTSPAWVITTCKALGEQVAKRVPELLESLPEPNRSACRTAWKDFGEVVYVENKDDAVVVSDEYAPEHLQVLVPLEEVAWWRSNLTNYGSLFLGEGTCVTYGDKSSGPNHTLPTRKAARHTGGLSVHKFLKIMTWQTQETNKHDDLAVAAGQISRLEGMEGHAWSADVRLAKFACTDAERKDLLRRSGSEGAGVAHLFDAHRAWKAPCPN